MKVDGAIAKLLAIDANNAHISSAGGGGCSSASTSKITATLRDGSEKTFFVKTGSGNDAARMFAGEHASLAALHSAVPSLCPASYGHGALADSPGQSFLVTDYLDLTASRNPSKVMSLAQKFAQLHTTPAPIPDGFDRPMFGFPATTCCGDTPQPNDYRASWAEFYAESRLRFIMRFAETRQGTDAKLRDLIAATADRVVPHLIGDDHLNNGKGVVPVVTHGDCWSGNAGVGSIGGDDGAAEPVVFDPSACYTHSEFEFGIMKMFGGFGPSFFNEYHKYAPKTEPKEEYDDRVRLYELYHHLNHYALFGGGYRSGAVSIMQDLIRKYGKGQTEL